MFRLTPANDIQVRKIKISRIPALVLSPAVPVHNAPGVLWIHGGGYFLGMKEMVYMGRAEDLVRKFGAIVVSPGYRMALQKPYPAAVEDCYQVLLYMRDHAAELGFRSDQLMVGGESAGGGLCAALCMLARDRGKVKISFQMPLYPMLDNFDTETSSDNRGRVWNTRRNHLGWRLYLRRDAGHDVSPYAAAARQKNYAGLPPAYTFVGDGEPFLAETRTYIENLRNAGVPADMDVYHTDMHAFDMIKPELEISRQAAMKFEERFAFAVKTCFASQQRRAFMKNNI